MVPAGRLPRDPQDQHGSSGSPRQATSQPEHTRPTQWAGSTGATGAEDRSGGTLRSGWSRDGSPMPCSGDRDNGRGAMRGTVAKARAPLGDPGHAARSLPAATNRCPRTTHPIWVAKEIPMSDPIPNPDGSSERRISFPAAPPMVIDPAKTYSAEMVTSMGTMTIHLDPIAAPQTVNNFVYLARWHYYDGLVFHRVINGFVIQGGCPEGSGRGGPGYRFADELPKPGRYEVGSLVMANAGPDTNGSQFFVVTGPSGVGLPPAYALFGKVIKGVEVATAIQEVRTGPGDRPVEDVVIESVTVTESD